MRKYKISKEELSKIIEKKKDKNDIYNSRIPPRPKPPKHAKQPKKTKPAAKPNSILRHAAKALIEYYNDKN